jgi:hypothetical protein
VIRFSAPLMIVLTTLAQGVAAQPAQTELVCGFQSPPSSARMWIDWFWINDNVDKEHITADLEAMKTQGFGGASVFGVHPAPSLGRGPRYMSPEYRALVLHAVLYITSTHDPQSRTVGVVEFQPEGVPALRSPFWWDIKSARTSFRVRPGYLVPIRQTMEALLHPLPPDHYCAPLEVQEIIDLTARLGADGILDWQVPEGKPAGVVMRFGLDRQD